MKNFFKLLAWFTNWIKRHNIEAQPPCALVSCSRYSQSLWQRLRHRQRPSGTFLQGAFYCQPQCLETALINQLSRLRVIAPSPQPPNRIPLGLLMVARGKLTHTEVRAALEAQRRARYGKSASGSKNLALPPNRKSPPPSLCNGDAPSQLPSIPPPSSLSATFRFPSSKPFRCCPSTTLSPPTPSTSPSENASTTPLSTPSKKFSLAALSPALPDAKVSPANSSSCANCPAPPTWNSAP